MTMTLYTVKRWIFNQKNTEVRTYTNGRCEIMDCMDQKNGMPEDNEVAILNVFNVLKETEKAVNLEVDCFERTWNIWIPKSQIVKIENVEVA